jgi:DNA-binding protein H-NS
MARSDLDKMTYAQLAAMELRVARLKTEEHEAERAVIRKKVTHFAKAHGFHIRELLTTRGRRKKAASPPNTRARDNPDDTWTGRGRMPRWMTLATKNGKARKEDFLIK